MNQTDIQYIIDENGHHTGVIVPIEIWDEIISESETHYLFKSETMRKRLLESMRRKETLSFNEVRAKLGI